LSSNAANYEEQDNPPLMQIHHEDACYAMSEHDEEIEENTNSE